MQYYGVWDVRSGASIFGHAEAWSKNDGVPLVFATIEDARKQAERYNAEMATANTHYSAKEMELELAQNTLNPQAQAEPAKDFPTVYPYSFEQARDYGELDKYSESNTINRECADAIDKAISANHEGYHYDTKAALAAVTAEYGAERVQWVIAGAIQKMDYDGRISRTNKDWAKTFTIPERVACVLNTHQTVLDGFADKVRQQEAEKVNPLINAELSLEQNYNSIDGILNNLPVVVDIRSACISNYEGMDALYGADEKVYLGNRDNYDNHGHYDNSDNSLVFISDDDKIYHLLYGSGCILSQAEALANEVYTRATYEEWARLLDGVLKDFTRKPGHEFLFDGDSFVHPDILPELGALNQSSHELTNERMAEADIGEMPKLRKYEKVDVLAALESVMKLNTKHYQTDFDIDKLIIMRSAQSEWLEDKTLLWMSRPSGTHCFRESDVFIKDFAPQNTWLYYAEQTKDKILAYSVVLSGVEDGKVMGTLHALDYEKHVDRVKLAAQTCAVVQFEYADGSTQDVPVKNHRNADHGGREGLTVHYLPEDDNIMKGILAREQADRNKLRPASFNRHLVLLDRALKKEFSVIDILETSKQSVKSTRTTNPKHDKGFEL